MTCKKHGEQPIHHLILPGRTVGICCALCYENSEVEEAWVLPNKPLRRIDLAVKPEDLRAA